MRKKIIIILVIAVIIIIAAAVILIKKNTSVSTLMPVEAQRVKIDTVTSTVKTDGTVEFKDTAVVYASTSAEIKKVNFEIGDKINYGDVIVEYDEKALDDLKNQLSQARLDLKDSKIALEKAQNPADDTEIKEAEIKINQAQSSINEAEYRLKQLESSVKQAEINVENAQKDYNDNSILFDNGVISREELDKYNKALVEAKNSLDGYNSQYSAEKLTISNAERDLESAENDYNSIVNKTGRQDNQKEIEMQKVQVEKAELKISQLEKDIADFHINEISPAGGTVIKIDVKEGEIPAEGAFIIEIAGNEDLIVKADIDEYDMKDIALGQKAKIKGDSFNGEIDGEITKIYPIAEEKEKYGSKKTMTTVELGIDSSKSGLLKAGYTVKAEITTKTNSNARVVPLTALMTDKDGNNYVYIVNKDNITERRNITLLGYSDMNIEADGIEENETVITQPDAVVEGQAVTPLIQGEENNSDAQ